MAADTFTCCETPIPWPTKQQDQVCPDCGLVWEREPVTIGAGAQIKHPQPEITDPEAGQVMGTVTAIGDGPRFPEGFQGAGPMFAAVPRGDRWLSLATRGVTTYSVDWDSPDGTPDGCAFVDRRQAEQVADARSGGYFYRNDGLTGWLEATAAAEAAERAAFACLPEGQADPYAADLDGPEPEPAA